MKELKNLQEELEKEKNKKSYTLLGFKIQMIELLAGIIATPLFILIVIILGFSKILVVLDGILGGGQLVLLLVLAVIINLYITGYFVNKWIIKKDYSYLLKVLKPIIKKVIYKKKLENTDYLDLKYILKEINKEVKKK